MASDSAQSRFRRRVCIAPGERIAGRQGGPGEMPITHREWRNQMLSNGGVGGTAANLAIPSMTRVRVDVSPNSEATVSGGARYGPGL